MLKHITLPGEDEVTDVYIETGEYPDGYGIGLRIVSVLGEPIATPTVNLSAHALYPPPGHVFVRDGDENEGMAEAMQEAGILKMVSEHPYGLFNSRAWLCELDPSISGVNPNG